MSCKDKIKSTCGRPTNSKCVSFEGKLSSKSKLDKCDCLDLEEVIEDMNDQLDDLYSQIDISGLESCLTLPEEYTQKQVNQLFSDRICEISDLLGIGDCPDCPTTPDPCSTGGDCCGSVVVAAKYWAGDVLYPNTLNQWNIMTGTDLNHTISSGTGYYKITLEHSVDFETTGAYMDVALKIDSVNPLPSLSPGFEISRMKQVYSKTVILYQKLNNGVTITPTYMKLITGDIQFDAIKMLVEKAPYQPN